MPDGALHQSALVLNQNYEPLSVCTVSRAFLLVFRAKAELLQAGPDELRAASMVFERPSVIRLAQQVRRQRPSVRLTRREVFARDHGRCQYCGRDAELTLDHVLPRHRGGRHEWDNVVAACRPCNHLKGGRTPAEARMVLRGQPFRPAASHASIFGPYLDRYGEWAPFLVGWLGSAWGARMAAPLVEAARAAVLHQRVGAHL
ncbi:MAG: HNH endonuclease [Chloroflexi bacterium]|nr:HNH endonuclease [Chloroflexota bacterium]